MRYPADFPPESCAAVAAEKLRAGKDFDRTRSNPQPMQGGIGHLEGELRKYILRPFGVFVSEACKLGHKGVWSVDRIEEAALEFLRLSTIDAQYSKGYDRSGRAFGRDWIDNWTGGIRPELMRQLERSEHWRQFQDALLQVADAGEREAALLEATHAGPQAFSPPAKRTPRKDTFAETGASVSSEAARSAPSEECHSFTSEMQRVDAVAAYTDCWQCSEAALARTARVDPADLSKWKKGLLPVESDKKARIETTLRNNEVPARSAKRSRSY